MSRRDAADRIRRDIELYREEEKGLVERISTNDDDDEGRQLRKLLAETQRTIKSLEGEIERYE